MIGVQRGTANVKVVVGTGNALDVLDCFSINWTVLQMFLKVIGTPPPFVFGYV